MGHRTGLLHSLKRLAHFLLPVVAATTVDNGCVCRWSWVRRDCLSVPRSAQLGHDAISASNREIFEQSRHSKSGRLDVHGTIQGFAGCGHYGRKLTPLEDGAGFQVMPHAALDHR